ncbi:MAG: DUF4340 domain-containing protein [Pirellulaceae bacterium]
MNGQTTRTLCWAILAAMLSGAAAYYYPWPQNEQQRSQVNQPLFEEFEDKRVSFIEIEQYNSDLQSLERLNLQRRGERYLFPGFDNFNADNIQQISGAIGSLRKTVLDVISDKVEDHTRFGVVDPQEFQSTSNRSYLGKKITLQDSNRGVIASLIVGLSPDDAAKQDQRYVRIEGQPSVYLVEFDDRFLTSKFADWVDKNLLRLDPQLNAPDKIVVENFRIDPEKLGENPPVRNSLYRATLELGPRSFPLRSLEVESNGEWKKTTPDQAQISKLESGLVDLGSFPLVKARRIDKEIIPLLKKPYAPAKPEQLEGLTKQGFRLVEPGNPVDMVSTGGRIEVFTNANVRISVLLGNFENTNQTRSKLARWALILAQPDLTKIKKPEPPKPAEGQELTEEQKAEAARADRDYQQAIAKAEQIAESLNSVHSAWLYSIDEEAFTKMRPELTAEAPNSLARPPEDASPAKTDDK